MRRLPLFLLALGCGVIDVRARKVTATFTAGNEPDGMAWAAERASGTRR